MISRIRIKKLFGLYTYDLPAADGFSNAAILYGDNGVGKSTILKLILHLLSPSGNRGHRSALYNIDFQRLDVTLSSGVNLIAEQIYHEDPEDSKVLKLSIVENDEIIAKWDFKPRSRRDIEEIELATSKATRAYLAKRNLLTIDQLSELSATSPYNDKLYLKMLSTHAPVIFLLDAERQLISDELPTDDDDLELRQVLRHRDRSLIQDIAGKFREAALSKALDSSARWLQWKTAQGANLGSQNVHSVYINVLRHLVQQPSTDIAIDSQGEKSSLIKRLTSIEIKTGEYADYGLTATLSMKEFKDVLGNLPVEQSHLISGLLKSYIDSLESRLDALSEVYKIVSRFIMIVNQFFGDKTIVYKQGSGFHINNRLGNELSPAQLSSGEQQLLLLFCFVISKREAPTVFMIDEPEISLNIKWQRQLIGSLLEITSDSKVQFLFASHSLELLTQHRDRVAKLTNADE